VRSLDPSKLALLEVRRRDVQYGDTFTFRGVPLQTLLERGGAPAQIDLALLHFANGMQVPYAFRDPELVKQLDLFVAVSIRRAPGRPFTTAFPPVSRARGGLVDVRPIAFGANKLVVSDRAHPAVPKAAQATFSPWLHVDSLTGIELVSAKAYYAQFDVDSSAQVHEGYRVFTETCQFCHGVRGVGAAFGWDFVEPVAAYRNQGTRDLFHQVRYKPLDAAARGLQMPALAHMSEEEATAIWRWMLTVATKPLASYAP
jgi:mono/diheme cytochrome c family protein